MSELKLRPLENLREFVIAAQFGSTFRSGDGREKVKRKFWMKACRKLGSLGSLPELSWLTGISCIKSMRR
jgi:hypothetical protein